MKIVPADPSSGALNASLGQSTRFIDSDAVPFTIYPATAVVPPVRPVAEMLYSRHESVIAIQVTVPDSVLSAITA